METMTMNRKQAKTQTQNAGIEKTELSELELESVNGGLWNIFLSRKLLNR